MTAIAPVAPPAAGATLPSGLVLPAGSSAPSGYTQSSSGLLVPAQTGVRELAKPQLVIASKDLAGKLDAETMLAQAREGQAQIAASNGAAAADVLLRDQFAIIDEVAAQERHDKVVADFFKGRVETTG